MALNHLGMLAAAQQDHRTAIALFCETLQLLHKTGTCWEVARTQISLATAFQAIGDLKEAEHTYRDAFTAAHAAQVIPDVLQAVGGLASIQSPRGDAAVAYLLALFVGQHPITRAETKRQNQELANNVLDDL